MTHPNAYAAIQSRGNFGKVDYNEKTTHTLNRVNSNSDKRGVGGTKCVTSVLKNSDREVG